MADEKRDKIKVTASTMAYTPYPNAVYLRVAIVLVAPADLDLPDDVPIPVAMIAETVRDHCLN